MLKLFRGALLCLAVLTLGACPPAAASPPITIGTLAEQVTVDSFKVTANFTLADPSKAAFTVSWLVTFADSVGGAVLGSTTVAVGSPAIVTLGHTLAPGQRFTVAVTAQGVNQLGALSVASTPTYAGFTALVGAPSPANPVTVTICRVGDPGC